MYVTCSANETTWNWRFGRVFLRMMVGFLLLSGNFAAPNPVSADTPPTSEAHSDAQASPVIAVSAAKTFSEKGMSHWDAGDVQGAIIAFEQAVQLYGKLKNLNELAKTFEQLGLCYTKVDRVRSGLDAFQSARFFYQQVANVKGQGTATANLAWTYSYLGEHNKALELYLQAIEFHYQAQNSLSVATSLVNMAGIHLQLGEYAKAEFLANREYDAAAALTKRALAIYLQENDMEGQILTLGSLAHILAKQKNPSADAFFKIAIDEANQRNLGGITGQLMNLQGTSLVESARYDEAIGVLEAAVKNHLNMIDSRLEYSSRYQLAVAFHELNRPDDALSQIDKALINVEKLLAYVQDPDLHASFYSTVADLYALKIQYSLESSRSSPGSATESLQKQAFIWMEQARVRSLLEQMRWHAAYEEGEIPSAIREQFERARTRLNLARRWLQNSGTDLKRSPDPSIRDEAWNDISWRTTWLAQHFQTCEQEYFEAERELRNASRSSLVKASPVLASIDDVQDKLGSNRVMCAYFLGEPQSYMWVISKRQATLEPLPGSRLLKAYLDAFRARLTSVSSSVQESPALDADQIPLSSEFDPHSEGNLTTLAYQLYGLLLAPAEKFLEPQSELVIVPDGLLAALPFEALVSSTIPYAKGIPSYLGLQRSIVYSPSATTWYEAQAVSSRFLPTSSLIIADPRYPVNPCGLRRIFPAVQHNADGNSDELKRLCYSAFEARKVKRDLIGMHSVVQMLKGRKATEEQLRTMDLSTYSLLHFSSHGTSDDEFSARSALILTSDHRGRGYGGSMRLNSPSDDDGWLELREIRRLKLRAQLVVLSACMTAQGRSQKGYGVESLAMGFLQAGARNVIASQWLVADQSTAIFMERFYHNLQKASIAAALLETRKSFILNDNKLLWRHPYFWAPFILVEGALN